MSFIQTNILCEECGVNYVLDFACNGDWYETDKGYVHQSFCPLCGSMLPLLPVEVTEISNTTKRKVLTKVASLKKLRYKVVFQEFHSAGLKDITSRDIFVRIVSNKYGLPKELILTLL